MTIYIVSSGEYSAYGIDAIFSTKEKAEQYILGHRDKESGQSTDEFNDIEEYEVDVEYQIPKWTMKYETHLQKDTGELQIDTPCNNGYTRRVLTGSHQRERSYVNDSCHWDTVGKKGCAIGESYISQEHAHKLAVEARQKYLREREFSLDKVPETE